MSVVLKRAPAGTADGQASGTGMLADLNGYRVQEEAIKLLHRSPYSPDKKVDV